MGAAGNCSRKETPINNLLLCPASPDSTWPLSVYRLIKLHDPSGDTTYSFCIHCALLIASIGPSLGLSTHTVKRGELFSRSMRTPCKNWYISKMEKLHSGPATLNLRAHAICIAPRFSSIASRKLSQICKIPFVPGRRDSIYKVMSAQVQAIPNDTSTLRAHVALS